MKRCFRISGRQRFRQLLRRLRSFVLQWLEEAAVNDTWPTSTALRTTGPLVSCTPPRTAPARSLMRNVAEKRTSEMCTSRVCGADVAYADGGYPPPQPLEAFRGARRIIRETWPRGCETAQSRIGRSVTEEQDATKEIDGRPRCMARNNVRLDGIRAQNKGSVPRECPHIEFSRRRQVPRHDSICQHRNPTAMSSVADEAGMLRRGDVEAGVPHKPPGADMVSMAVRQEHCVDLARTRAEVGQRPGERALGSPPA